MAILIHLASRDMLFGGTFWVMATNILLGLATLVLLVIVAGAALREAIRYFRTTGPGNARDRAVLRRLGVTLPDGGDPIDEMEDLKSPENRN